MSGGDQWLRNFERLNKLGDEVQVDINERNRRIKSDIDTQKLTTTIRRKLSQLNTEILTLEEELERMADEPAMWRVTQNEVQRRQDLLNNLANKRNQLEHAAKAGATATQGDLHALLSPQGANMGSGTSTSGFGGRSRIWGAPSETDETRPLTEQEIVALQRKKLADQNSVFAAISHAAFPSTKTPLSLPS